MTPKANRVPLKPFNYTATQSKQRNQMVLYRHFGIGNVLLYVGISNTGAAIRYKKHIYESDFFDQVILTTYERGFTSVSELIDAETRAIHNERPLYNKNKQSI